jgi:protein-S-isoprenylcysteine O-methyltransferase Ste14
VIELFVTLGTLGAVITPVFYATVPWRKSLPGRAVMTMAVVIMLVMLMAFFRNVLGIYLPEWLRTVGFLLIVFGIWTKLIILVYVNSGWYKPPHNRRFDDVITETHGQDTLAP